MNSLVKVTPPANGVLLIQLDSPETRNGLTVAMRRQISNCFTEAAENDAVNCVVLTGGDTCFSAGADVRAVVDCSPSDLMREAVEQYWLPLKNFSKPIVAAVNGFALGGGCELAMHADIIIAGESAMFGQPEVRLGIMPGSGGTQRLPRAVGKFRAMKLLLTGSPFSATEAYDMGVVSEVVEDSRAIEEAMKIAETIARQPAVAVRKIKEVVLAGLDVPLETGLLLERQALHLLFDTGDQREGMLAFLEKRKPKFSGQ